MKVYTVTVWFRGAPMISEPVDKAEADYICAAILENNPLARPSIDEYDETDLQGMIASSNDADQSPA